MQVISVLSAGRLAPPLPITGRKTHSRTRPTPVQWMVGVVPLVLGIVCAVVGLLVTGVLLVVVGAALLAVLTLLGNPRDVHGPAPRTRAAGAPAGEAAVVRILGRLDDRYYLLNGIQVRVANSQTPIDHVLVGPRGVFVLEAQDDGGTYVFAGGSWRIDSFKGGATQSRPIDDPTLKARTDAQLLSEYLLPRMDVRSDVVVAQPIVVLTSSRAIPDFEDEQPIPVVAVSELVTLLKLYSEDRLNAPEATRVVEVLQGKDMA